MKQGGRHQEVTAPRSLPWLTCGPKKLPAASPTPPGPWQCRLSPSPRPHAHCPPLGPGVPEPGQNAQQQQGDGLRVRRGLKRSPGSRSFPRPSHNAAARLVPDRRPGQRSARPTSRHRLPPWRTPRPHSARRARREPPAGSARPCGPRDPRLAGHPASRGRSETFAPAPPLRGETEAGGDGKRTGPRCGLAPASHSPASP